MSDGSSVLPCGRAQGLATIWVRAQGVPGAWTVAAEYVSAETAREAEPIAVPCQGGADRSCRRLRRDPGLSLWAVLITWGRRLTGPGTYLVSKQKLHLFLSHILGSKTDYILLLRE